MKKLPLSLLCLSWLTLVQAQQLRPDVLASAGASMSNAANTARLSFTIGEVAIQGQSYPTYSYGQGFHNGVLQTVRVTDLNLLAWGIEVWPNPVGNTLFLRFTAPTASDFLTASVWNLLGQPVLGERRLDGFSEKSMPVESLASGVYLLRLTDSSGKSAGVKFVKTN